MRPAPIVVPLDGVSIRDESLTVKAPGINGLVRRQLVEPRGPGRVQDRLARQSNRPKSRDRREPGPSGPTKAQAVGVGPHGIKTI